MRASSHSRARVMSLRTDKMTVELEAPAAGVLASIEAAAGATATVRERVAVIDEAKEGR